MNDLQICKENGKLVDIQIEACNSAIDFFDVISKKGPRDFITQMGKLRLKAKEIQLKEYELQTSYDIAEMKENNRYRLAILNAQKEVKMEEQRTLQIRIKEQSKCFQKLIDSANNAYNRKIDFYEMQLQNCVNFFQPQIQMISQELSVLNQQRDASYGNQEVLVILQRQISRLSCYLNDINEKYMQIQQNLTNAVNEANLDYSNSISGFIN